MNEKKKKKKDKRQKGEKMKNEVCIKKNESKKRTRTQNR